MIGAFPCNEPHSQSMCFNGALNQALNGDNYHCWSSQRVQSRKTDQQQGALSNKQSAPNDTTL
ncbi:hypothetical protein KI387_018450, partial [Taxus chinensis]